MLQQTNASLNSLSVWVNYLLICAFSSENYFLKFCYIILAMRWQNRVRKLDGNFALGCGPGVDYP
jgi:hypothetical protein